MIRDYMLVSPSLDGVLSHDKLTYEGLVRPNEILRVLDGPASKGRKSPPTDEEIKALEAYFHDLYGVFMKRFSHFVVDSSPQDDEILQIQALIQEMIKVKKMLGRG